MLVGKSPKILNMDGATSHIMILINGIRNTYKHQKYLQASEIPTSIRKTYKLKDDAGG